MKYFPIVLLLTIITFLSACKQNNNAEVPKVSPQLIDSNKFSYYPDSSLNYLTANVLVNGKFPGKFILDNGTHPDDKISYTIDFARKYLLKDTSLLTQIYFANDSVTTISFGGVKDTTVGCNLGSLPRVPVFPYDGLIGLGVLKNYILEVNYDKNYFKLHHNFSYDSTSFSKIVLDKGGMCPELHVDFFSGNRSYNFQVSLDLGLEGDGFLFMESAANDISINKEDIVQNGEMNFNGTAGASGKAIKYIFDSVRISGQVLKNTPSSLVVSGTGRLSDNSVAFGNGILRKFGLIFIDFKNNLLYLPKTIRQ